MAKFPRAGILTLLVALTATLLVPASATASWQNGSDAAIYPLAVCRDGIRFLFAADWYPAGDESSDDEAPFRIQSVQAATPCHPSSMGGRSRRRHAGADVTVNVPYAPRDRPRHFLPATGLPEVPPNVVPSGYYPQPRDSGRRVHRRLHLGVDQEAQGRTTGGGAEL